MVNRMLNHPLCTGQSTNSEYLWFRPDSREIWQCICENELSLYVQCHYAAGSAHEYDKLVCQLNRKVKYVTPEFQRIKARAELFAGDFAAAARALMSDTPEEGDIGYKVALAGCILACEENVSERMLVHLKTSAYALAQRDRFDDSSVLLRIAGLDQAAADYFMECDQLDHALSFIRGMEGDAKVEMLLKFGLKQYEKKNMRKAVLVFMISRQYHLGLGLLYEMHRKVEAFFLKKWLVREGMLVEMESAVAKLFPQILDLITLIAQIDSDIAEYCTELGMDTQQIRRILG
jgi:hypothetical protein